MIVRRVGPKVRGSECRELIGILSVRYSRIIGESSRSVIRDMARNITMKWWGRCWGVEKRRVDIVSTCAPVEERIFGGCVSPARVAFVCRVAKDTRMIVRHEGAERSIKLSF